MRGPGAARPAFDFAAGFRYGIAALFLAIMCLSIFLVRWKLGGVPVRTVLVLGLLFAIVLARLSLVLQALSNQGLAVLIVGYAALCGALASIVAGNDTAAFANQLIEIHFQAIIGLIVGYSVLRICGLRSFALLFVLPIGISAAFAVLQFLGLEPAWAVYDRLAAMQPQSTAELWFHNVRYRPLGLSYSPVHLGTQICLAFAVLLAYRAAMRGTKEVLGGVDRWVLALVAAACIATLASGNRSPLLGIILFLGAFVCRARPAVGISILIIAPVLMMLGDIVSEMMNTSGLRAFNTTNSSGEGRAALRAYGMLLFFDQPLGYGLTFNSVDHWWKYWAMIQNYENAGAIAQHALHNFYLGVLNKHGVLLLAIIPIIAYRLWYTPLVCFAFIPYMVHLFYHNDGPLQGDFMFWYAVPFFSQAVVAGARASKSRAGGPVRWPVPRFPAAAPAE